jgi:hypothetical protein
MPSKTPKVRTKFPTKAAMKAVGVFNPRNLASTCEDDVCIHFSASDTKGRATRAARYSVHRKNEKTDPKNAHWMDYGYKAFSVFGAGKEKALAEAIAWTDAKYGKRVWVRDPWGSYQDERTIAAVWALIDKKAEEANA